MDFEHNRDDGLYLGQEKVYKHNVDYGDNSNHSFKYR